MIRHEEDQTLECRLHCDDTSPLLVEVQFNWREHDPLVESSGDHVELHKVVVMDADNTDILPILESPQEWLDYLRGVAATRMREMIE